MKQTKQDIKINQVVSERREKTDLCDKVKVIPETVEHKYEHLHWYELSCYLIRWSAWLARVRCEVVIVARRNT